MKALRKVGRQIAQLRRDLKTAVKEVNAEAARKVARGNYGASQDMMELAKAVQQFTTDAKEFNTRWTAISRRRTGRSQIEITPVWEYYRLVARAIASAGGESRFEEIIDWIGRNATSDLKPGDMLDGPKGGPVWQRAVSKAKRPMIKEGFLEPGAGKWKLTKSGRNIVSQSS
jgi:hypothetical protein